MADRKPILVVDDDVSILDIVEIALEDEGYDVARAQDGLDALNLLSKLDPALILLDMRMPGMNGWEFADAYRQQFSHRSPIVVMTAGQDAVDKCTQVGAEGCLPKPFDLDDLVETVHRYARNGQS